MLTEKDRELIKRASNLPSIKWAECLELSKKAETEKGKEIIKSISSMLYHKDEFHAGLL